MSGEARSPSGIVPSTRHGRGPAGGHESASVRAGKWALRAHAVMTRVRCQPAGSMSRGGLLVSIALAMSGALTLSACGTSRSAVQAAAAAARSTLSQNADSTTTMEDATAFGERPLAIVARGTFVLQTGFGYEAIDLPANGQQPTRTEYLAFAPTTAYLEPVSAEEALPKGKSWISVPLDGSSSLDASLPRLVEQLEGLTPRLLLAEVAWGATSATNAGQQVVDHAPLTEYVVTVALRKVLSGATGPMAKPLRAAVDKELAALESSRVDRSPSLRVTIWVDGPGLVEEVRGSVPGSGLGTDSVVISGFGAKIATSLPLRQQVVDITDLLPAAQGPFSPWVIASRA